MIGVDTNILVYAHRADSEWNAAAYEALTSLTSSRSRWAIPWPCVHEFFSIVTHPRIFDPPSTIAEALAQIEAWLAAKNVVLLAEDETYGAAFTEVVRTARIRGPKVHDARIAVLCRVHGVRELWTADRDFGRFGFLVTRNPLTAR